MHAHLFIPCLVEDCQPEAALAVAQVLERLGVEVRHPAGQTCCGQLAYKTGDVKNARLLAARYLDIFAAPGPVVCPSGSCVKMVRTYPELFPPGSALHARALALAARTFVFCEYVAGLLIEELGARWDRVTIAKLGMMRGVKRVGVIIERGERD